MPREIPIAIFSINSEDDDQVGLMAENENKTRKPLIKLADDSFEYHDDDEDDDDNYSIEELENAVFSELDADDGNNSQFSFS